VEAIFLGLVGLICFTVGGFLVVPLLCIFAPEKHVCVDDESTTIPLQLQCPSQEPMIKD
jgi:hypothetical protein